MKFHSHHCPPTFSPLKSLLLAPVCPSSVYADTRIIYLSPLLPLSHTKWKIVYIMFYPGLFFFKLNNAMQFNPCQYRDLPLFFYI